MNHSEYAQQILVRLLQAPATLPSIEIDDTRRNNAGRCMTALVHHRLTAGGELSRHIRHTTFDWNGGVLTIRNSRINDYHWSTVNKPVVQKLHQAAQERPVVYLLTHWSVGEGILHAWAVPEDVAFDAFGRLPPKAHSDSKAVEVSLEDHKLENAPFAPTFSPYYVRAELTEAERAKLLEAIKTDDNIKQERLGMAEESAVKETEDAGLTDLFGSEEEDEFENEAKPGYSDQTVKFLFELPEHDSDVAWHEHNKRRFQQVLRDPSASYRR